MSLKSILRKIAGVKEVVQKGANYDKINIADDIRERSPLAKQVVDRNARIFHKAVLGDEVTPLPEELDTNQPATLAVQEFVFTSVAENPAANLLTLEMVAGSVEAIEVIDNHIKITLDTDAGDVTVSDHDSIKALIDGDSEASALITVAINAGQGATAVTVEDVKEFRGAIG